jgi:hypothetical protein
MSSVPVRGSVERVENLTRASFENLYVSRGRPVVVANATRNWKALSGWTADYLKAKAGTRTVPVTYSPGVIYERRNPRPMLFGDYLDLVMSDEPDRRQYYVTGVTVNRTLPELVPDFACPEIIAGLTSELSLFLGRDTATGCHFHPYEQAILCQIVGRKRVVLYPPTEFSSLYPKGPLAGHFNWSRVPDVDQPDLEKFSRFRDAQALECTVESGDMLFIPIHWWHSVYGPGWSVSGTFFWQASFKHWHFPRPALRCLVAWPFLHSGKLRSLIPTSVRAE